MAEEQKLSLKSLNERIDGVTAQLEDVAQSVNALLNQIKDSQALASRAPAVEAQAAPVTVTPSPVEPQFPVPLEYQQLIHDTLNKKFGIEMRYLTDSAAFELSILVPREYSDAGQAHWETYHEDRRVKVIQNAYGINGVREWVTLVYESLSPETKSRVTMDRATNV